MQWGLPSSQYVPQFFAASRTLTIAKDGVYRLSVLGAGGSGAVQCDAGVKVSATGGGGGGFCELVVSLYAGDALVMTIGVGGAGRSSNAYSAGVAGGETSLVCAGRSINMVATGGGGGVGGTANGTYAGGAGGVGSGGDFNATGGAGGQIIQPAGATTLYASGGGASGSPFGTGGRGGNMAADAGFTPATGGGGVGGGNGGDITGGNEKATGGGSVMESALANVTSAIAPGRNGVGLYAQTSLDGFARTGVSTSSIGISFGTINNPFQSLLGGGSVGVLGESPSPSTTLGGGTGGGIGVNMSPTGNAYYCGGTGGNTYTTDNASGVSGTCSFGGGSGGFVNRYVQVGVTGAGGQGLICVERIS